MSHPIVKIDELLRLVIDELIETSPQTAVSLALTCRSLEEPTLSSLWRQQHLLSGLVRVLPNHTWVKDEYGFGLIIAIGQDPSAEDWARLRRYASWMRGIHLGYDGNITSDTLFRLSSNSPSGVLFPRLEWLRWSLRGAYIALTFSHLFLSPHLRHVIFYNDRSRPVVPWDRLAALVQVISSLPTSLEYLSIMCGYTTKGPLKDAISSFVLRSGSSLRSFSTCVPLSGAAILRLMVLPNLRYWTIVQGPPPAVPTSIFPSLEQLRLDEPAALPWLHLLASHGSNGILQNGSTSAASHPNIRETLKSLDCLRSTIVDSTLLSSTVKFRNLVTLRMHTFCYHAGGCVFHLTDQNTETLAAALPRLKNLELGQPCHLNSCNATITSLVSVSAHCLDLTTLETHFNTLKIVSDMRRLLGDSTGRGEAKCRLRSLSVGLLGIDVCEEDTAAVAMGFKVIFPYLTNFTGHDDRWRKLESKLGD